jgi:hypothetical protein
MGSKDYVVQREFIPPAFSVRCAGGVVPGESIVSLSPGSGIRLGLGKFIVPFRHVGVYFV